MTSLAPRAPFIQFSIRVLLLIILCASAGAFIGSRWVKPIRLRHADGREVHYVSRNEVLRDFKNNVEAFKTKYTRFAQRNEAQRAFEALTPYFVFTDNESELAAGLGAPSPALAPDDIILQTGNWWYTIIDGDGKLAIRIKITWPNPDGYVQLFFDRYGSGESSSSFSSASHSKMVTVDQYPDTSRMLNIGMFAMFGAGLGMLGCLFVRLIVGSRVQCKLPHDILQQV